MQVVQSIVSEVFGSDMVLGAKLDDSSVAYGAALAVSTELQRQAAAAASAVAAAAAAASATDGKEETETNTTPEDEAANACGTEEAVNVISNGEEYGDNCLGFTTEEIEAAKQQRKECKSVI